MIGSVSGRHRTSPATPPSVRAAGVAIVILLLLSGSWFGYRRLVHASCAEPVHISVAAAVDIEPVVQQTAAAWVAGLPKANGRCVGVDVVAAEPADVAAAVAGQAGVTLNGLGQANGKTRVPDVWVPDSSTWLQRLRSAGKNDVVPAQAPSLARSPVVVAMPEPVAKSLGWPTAKLGWADLLKAMTSNAQLHAGIVEPNRDAAGLAGLLALGTAANAAPGGQQAAVGALRALATGRSLLRDDLLVRFPRAPDPATIAAALSAAPLSEQAVIAYNASQPPVRLAALYIEPAPVPLDYPYTVLPGLVGDRLTAANQFRAALSGQTYDNALAAHGLRTANGTVGAGFATPQGAPIGAGPKIVAPDPAVVSRSLATWTAVTLPARLLAVIDVSGSMLTPVPTAGNATREQVLLEAAKRGLSLFDDSWVVGLWTFSTQLDGENDYKELVPIGPLSSQRTQLIGALGTVKPKANGDTGLYDTILAGYKAMQKDWDPGRVNSLVVMTDGQNDDKHGVSLDQLISTLKGLADPKRPIQVITIGIGTDVSRDELTKITSTTGGGVFVTADPSKIGDIFLQAIALRPSH
jgi:Ca-activated chloride channel family protein